MKKTNNEIQQKILDIGADILHHAQYIKKGIGQVDALLERLEDLGWELMVQSAFVEMLPGRDMPMAEFRQHMVEPAMQRSFQRMQQRHTNQSSRDDDEVEKKADELAIQPGEAELKNESESCKEVSRRRRQIFHHIPAEQTKLPAPKNTTRHPAVDTAAFNRLIQLVENTEDDELFAALDLPILRLIQNLMDMIFKDHKDLFFNLQFVGSHFLSVINQLPRHNKAVGAFIRMKASKKAAVMESEAEFNSGVGSILTFYEKSMPEGDVKDEDQINDIYEEVFAIKRAIHRAMYGYSEDQIKHIIFCSRRDDIDDASVEERDSKVTDKDVRNYLDETIKDYLVEKHISVGSPTRNLLTHLLNCFLVADLLSRMSIFGVFQHLKNDHQLIREVKEFALEVNPELKFEEKMSAMNFLLSYVSPALKNQELLEVAWKVANNVLASLNKIVSVGPKANAEKRENDPRKNHMTVLLRASECQTIFGETDESAELYWSGAEPINRDRRLRAIRTFACLYLMGPIKTCLPSDFFDEFGFTHTILCQPASSIGRLGTVITTKFLVDCSDEMPAFHRKKFDDIFVRKLKVDDSGERTVFIQTEEQCNSLKLLLQAHEALMSGSKIGERL